MKKAPMEIPKFKFKLSPQELLYSTLSLFLVAVMILAVIAAIALSRSSNRMSNGGNNTIVVSATGEAYAAPDIAEFTFSLEKLDKDVAVAQDSVTKRSNAVIEQVKQLGVDKKDIQTQNFAVYPEYQWINVACPDGSYGNCGGEQKLVGYRVSHTVIVKLRDMDQVGAVLVALGTAKVDNLQGPNLRVEDEEAVLQKARTQAIEKARVKAKEMASTMGVRLGKIVSFNEGGQAYPMYEMATADMAVMSAGAPMAKVATPQIATGENKLTANVTITYRIK
jgi:uncharacterized protein